MGIATADEIVWRIEKHVCAGCFGRILSREGDQDGGRVYRCADCGTEKPGASTRVLCTCGVKLNARSAGIRCEPNPKRSADFPFEIVAMQVV